MSEVKCSTCKGSKYLSFERGARQVPCVTCSGSGIDWRKTYESAQSELAALREELAEWKARAGRRTNDMGELSNEKLELQQRLTAAEQRNAELQGLLTVWMFGYETGTLGPGHSNIYARTMATLKPTESGASE